MNRISKVLLTAASMTAMTGVAFADDPPADPNAGGGGGDATGAGAGATVGAEVAPDGAKVEAAAGAEITLANYPTSYVDRPQNITKGNVEVSPKFQFLRQTADDGMGNSTSTNITDLGVGARYGITDKIEVLGAFNRIILSGVDGIETGDRLKGQLAVGAGIVVAKGKLDVEVKAGIIDELGGLGIEALVLQAGADVRFHVNDKIWIGTPNNRSGLIAGLTNIKFGGMEIPDSKPLEIQIPLAVAFQATPQLGIQANTRLFDIALNDASKGVNAMGEAGSAVQFISQDEFGGIPLDFDVIYGMSNKMDVIVNLDLVDLKNAGDFLAITAGVNLRL
jgi:hypothetical protein